MSKKNKKRGTKSANSEKKPWEQPIYDTKYSVSGTRSQRRKKKSGSALFIKLLIPMLILIVALPLAWLAYIQYDSSNSTPTPTSSSSSTAPSESSSSVAPETEPTEVSEAPVEEEPPASEEETIPSEDESTYQYATVRAGDGHYTFAQRNGISLETLYELNDMNQNTVIMPDESLRIS